MAIKGKSKSRGAKTVATGPKPAYVPVKTPILQRRGLWITVGSVLVTALVVALAIGFIQQRDDDRERERLARLTEAVNEYKGSVEPVLANIGQVLPPSSFDAFPELTTAVVGLEAEEIDDAALEQATTTGEAVAESAENAATVLQEIDTTELLSGRNFSRDFVVTILNAQGNLVRAMTLYQHVAQLTVIAAEADEDVRGDLVGEVRGFLDVAEETFERAYADYVEAQISADVFEPVLGLSGAAGPTG